MLPCPHQVCGFHQLRGPFVPYLLRLLGGRIQISVPFGAEIPTRMPTPAPEGLGPAYCTLSWTGQISGATRTLPAPRRLPTICRLRPTHPTRRAVLMPQNEHTCKPQTTPACTHIPSVSRCTHTHMHIGISKQWATYRPLPSPVLPHRAGGVERGPPPNLPVEPCLARADPRETATTFTAIACIPDLSGPLLPPRDAVSSSQPHLSLDSVPAPPPPSLSLLNPPAP